MSLSNNGVYLLPYDLFTKTTKITDFFVVLFIVFTTPFFSYFFFRIWALTLLHTSQMVCLRVFLLLRACLFSFFSFYFHFKLFFFLFRRVNDNNIAFFPKTAFDSKANLDYLFVFAFGFFFCWFECIFIILLLLFFC